MARHLPYRAPGRAMLAFALVLQIVSFFSAGVGAIHLDADDPKSIRTAARTIKNGILALYSNGRPNTPAVDIGLFPYPPYYWWQSGATWAGLVDYVSYTGDTSVVPTITTALLGQSGPDSNFINAAHRFDTGNDDQAFWGLGVMSALENRFPEPPAPNPSWLTMVTRLFDNQTARWDMTTCGGGLKWQIYPENAYGYNYKNSVSNGAYFQLAGRLARYTGNPTYVALAQRTWDWCQEVGLISPHYDVYDGSDDKINCTQLDHTQWTYNVGLFLHGAAALWNHTQDPVWADRVNGLLDAAGVFFSPYANATGIMFEAACEQYGTCNTDQYSFKGYLSRWMAKTMVLCPWTEGRIMPLLRTSAVAAARACSGGVTRTSCGHRWYLDGAGFDGTTGLGQQQGALETVQSLLVWNAQPLSPWMESGGVAAQTVTVVELPGAVAPIDRVKRHGGGHDDPNGSVEVEEGTGGIMVMNTSASDVPQAHSKAGRTTGRNVVVMTVLSLLVVFSALMV